MTALHLAEASAEPTVEIRTVTPAVAKRWLSRNVRNRKIRPSVVDGYARDMAAGSWKLTGEGIKFDTNGALSDGQHRLAAIVKANTSVPLLVVRGVEPDAQDVMDSGVKRSASDALVLKGKSNPTILAAVARLALREPAAGYTAERISAPTHSEIADFIADMGHAIERAAEIASHYYPAFDAPPSVLGVCWMRFSAIDHEAAAQFFASIADMQTNGTGDPRSALIRRLQNARRNNERLSQVVYLSLIFRAWNAWRTGRTVAKFQSESRGEQVKVPTRLA